MEFINLKNLCNISKIFKNFKICCQSCTFNYKLISFELFFFWSKFPSKLAARIRKAFWNGVINNRFWIMHLTNWVSFFFLVFAVLLFYSYPIIPFSYSSSSSKNMAQETPNSIYDFTVKVFFNLSSSFLSGFFFFNFYSLWVIEKTRWYTLLEKMNWEKENRRKKKISAWFLDLLLCWECN